MVEWNVFLLPTTELSCEERNTTKTINLERSNHPKRIYWMLNVLLPLREAVKQVPHWNTERLCGTHKQQPLHNSTLTVYLSWNFYRSNFSSPKNVNNFKTICILESIILLQAIIQTEATRFACTRLWNYHLYIVHLLPETIINRKWISNKISLPFDWRFSCSLLTARVPWIGQIELFTSVATREFHFILLRWCNGHEIIVNEMISCTLNVAVPLGTGSFLKVLSFWGILPMWHFVFCRISLSLYCWWIAFKSYAIF